jgi:hypothetical protein
MERRLPGRSEAGAARRTKKKNAGTKPALSY